ncbi:DNA polymerase III subunit alpha [Paenibacillus sp. GCM10023248]|uniref:DNA polymerase III subunit alpha n=1 Tax=unclassified Paenibacillus TaxID=185978 RepID=UPI002379CDE6|nr:DNA polymerase III subunit alpha [Paenibacillus sp. MAHUQ-63]MDD9265918.1 DNA polymerase III subunit alpha [Paenibacillus sp. MAHUQ-63]
MSSFVHLHVHSEYSLLDGAARMEELVSQAANLGMTSLALTDHGVMYGAIAFYKACKQRGIKPIIGCEVYFTAGSLRDKGTRQEQPIYHLILLAKNDRGYQNLMKLVSIGHLEGFHYKPRIDLEHLAQYAEGLICLSSCLGSEISQHLLHNRTDEARQAAERYRAIFGDDFFLEIQDHGMIEQKKVMVAMIELSKQTGIPLIATNDVHYVTEPDHVVQDVLICIGTGKTVEDTDRLKMGTSQMYLKSEEEMRRLFVHVPEALANTEVVASRCDLQLEFGKSILPKFRPIPDGLAAADYLRELCLQGLEQRYAHKPEWQQAGSPLKKQAEERLGYELGVIEKMGFSDYFLIVWDFIRFAHEKQIMTGPGRGSSAGSLVAYVLRITNVDPLQYKLLFERFLNPERITMPDIDIDFSDERRDEVIDYVVAKYGHEHVAQIITFGTMAAKAAVRDVGRVLNVPYGDVDRAAKAIPNQLGVTIAEALQISSDLKTLVARQPKTSELLDMAMRVEGMPRHASTHAAGVVISREPLTQYVPLQEGTTQTALTQYTMEHLESIGLLKMDFLGLRTLSIIERTVDWIKQMEGVRLNFDGLDMDEDAVTYGMLSKGETTGVFQLESTGVRKVLKDLKPSVFEDIISVLALYRPGPMEFIPKYIYGKHGQVEVDYPHPLLEPILKDTYGIIVYQEQIMQIASSMAGFSLGEADLLRRAVSKKKREVLDEERTHFVKGSLQQGFRAEDANRVYDMIVRFADYGFPRAHATAYGVLAFQTAYLKAHYPIYFMASMLTAVMGNHRKVAEYVDECRRMKIEVLPPDVNGSGTVFTPDPQAGAIRFGLAAIKNVGTQAIDAILSERRQSPFESLLDFCRRVDLRICNKRVVESLIQGGAFDSLGTHHRAQLMAILDETIASATKWRKERDDLQLHLFGFVEEPNWEVEVPNIPVMPQSKQLELEKELLGMYISGHPLDAYSQLLSEMDAAPLHQLAELPDNSEVLVAGMILSNKTIVTKKGQPMAFMELEDRIDKVEVVLFPETWKQAAPLVQKGRLVLVRAKLQLQDEDPPKLLAEQLAPLDDPAAVQRLRRQPRAAAASGGARSSGAGARTASPPAGRRGVRAGAAQPAREAPAAEKPQRVFVKIPADSEQPDKLLQLKALLKLHKGPLAVALFYESSNKLLALSDQYLVDPSKDLIRMIETIMGKDSVRVK